MNQLMRLICHVNPAEAFQNTPIFLIPNLDYFSNTIKMKVLSEMVMSHHTKVYENFRSVDGKDCIQKDVLVS